jgi:hypothetical protein
MPDEQPRTKAAFEPPPWEREAFEELARKRAAAQERGRATTEAATAEGWATTEAASSVPGVAGPRPPAGAPATGTPDASVAAETAGDEGTKLDERQAAAMLLQLRGEEASVQHAVRPLGTVVSIVIGVIGAGMLVVALYFTAKTAGSALGLVGAFAVGGFGMFFMGMAIWLWVRTTHAKGS